MSDRHIPAVENVDINDRSDPEAREIYAAAYRLPLELDIVTDKGTRAEKIEITKRLQTFNFKTYGKPLRLKFDLYGFQRNLLILIEL